MKSLIFGALALLSAFAISQAVAATCFKTGERMAGMNRICYYNCMGSDAAITIGAAEICPLSIER